MKKKVRLILVDPRFNRVTEKEIACQEDVHSTVKSLLGNGELAALDNFVLESGCEEHTLVCCKERQKQKQGPYFVLISPHLESWYPEGFIRIYGKGVILKKEKEKVVPATLGVPVVKRSISYKPNELRKIREIETKIEALEELYNEICSKGGDLNLKLMAKHNLEALYWALGKAEELPVIEKNGKIQTKSTPAKSKIKEKNDQIRD